jgi:hypothetical protein
LGLDRRGRWLIKNEPISHRGAVEFLSRNYANDPNGQWFVQNGPQRAYCSLDYTPWIYHLDGDDQILAHTNQPTSTLRGLILDDEGNLLLETGLGIGLLQDRDLGRFIDRLDTRPGDGRGGADVASLLAEVVVGRDGDLELLWDGAQIPVRALRAVDVPSEFGFVRIPTPQNDGRNT